MKHILTGIVGALMLTVTSAQAYYTSGVYVEDGQCGQAMTSVSSNNYWIDRLALENFSLNDSIDYHEARSNGNNFNAAALCWMKVQKDTVGVGDMETTTKLVEFLRSDMWSADADQVLFDLEQGIGFVPPSVNTSGSDLQLLWSAYNLNTEGYVPVPRNFLRYLPGGEHADFQKGWAIANGLGDPNYGGKNVAFLENWSEQWAEIVDSHENGLPGTHGTITALSVEHALQQNWHHLDTRYQYRLVSSHSSDTGDLLGYLYHDGTSWLYSITAQPDMDSLPSSAVEHAASISEYYY